MLDVHSPPVAAEKTLTSSNRIEAEADRRLRRSSSVVLRNVDCQFRDGVLLLRGQLPSFHHKQIAQEMLIRIDGVTRIENQIEVINPDSSTWLG